jgi:hypothetical protein
MAGKAFLMQQGIVKGGHSTYGQLGGVFEFEMG